jgi:predicted dehydrogenase
MQLSGSNVAYAFSHAMNTYIPTNSRRSFLKGLTATTAAGIAMPNLLLRAQGTPAGKKLGIGCIGVGGKGFSDMMSASWQNEIVAICDVDANNLAKAAKKFPNAKQYRDFREMLEKEKGIDGVTVSTPDHSHYPAAMHAISLGKHICVQKPLVNTLWEARELHKAAAKKGIITQMGNQGHTYEENRRLKEFLDAGAIGKISEIHVWTNRPIWPQGSEAAPKPVQPVPGTLDWQLWLAATPDVDYRPDIHPFKWRGLFEYGAGALGDMGCHNLDPIVWALGLGVPDRIEATTNDLTDIAWPRGAKVEYVWDKVPGHGEIKLYWYEGKNTDGSDCLPPKPKDLDKPLGSTGFYLVGENGILCNEGSQAQKFTILPEARSKEFLANPPAKTLDRSPTPGDAQKEWSLAVKQGKHFPFMSQFDYAVPLTELCLLGALAIRTGAPIHWDQENYMAVENDEANKLIKRAQYRDGWDYSAAKI